MNTAPLILIIDDDLLLQRATQRVLEQAGYRTCQASDGLSGLQMARDHKPALTLLDVNLPDISGLEVCQLIKTDLSLAGCFVMLLSSERIDPESQVTGLDTGADGYIVRPVTNGELLARVRGMLRIRQAEDALRASETRYRTVANFTYDWEAWRAPDGRYLYISPSCERVSGHTQAEFQSNAELFLQITHPDDRKLVSEHAHSVFHHARGDYLEFDFRIITPNGETRWIGHSCTAVYAEDGEWLGRRENNRDITERKQAEQALQDAHNLLEERVAERTAELRAANLALEKASRLKDEFLASMSHELRTPLTTILGLSEALRMPQHGPLTAKQNTYLTHIHESGQHLLELINEILDLTKIGAGKLALQLAPCSLDEICRASLQITAEQAAAKHLQFSFSMEPESIVLNVDALRLKQIVVNLLSNAIKFTPQDGSFGIEILGKEAEKQVLITVWDTGIGIQEEDISRLFQAFVQLDARLSRQYAGTGLGLALVRQLTELHGGTVSVVSVPDQGSRFTVTLPWQ